MGLVLGLAARLWMRLLTTDRPEFSVQGSALVIGAFALVGLASGLVRAITPRRRVGRMTVRVGAILLLVPMFVGAGGMLLPTVLFGSLAAHRHHWRPWVRGLCLLLALVVPVVLIATAELTLRTALGVPMFVMTYAVVIAMVEPIAARTVEAD